MAKLKIKNIFTKILKGALYSLGFFFVIAISLLIILNIPSVKEKIAQKALSFLNDKFKTEISVQRIEVDYLGNIILHDAMVKDHHQHEFIQIKELKAYANTISLLKNILIKKVNDIEIDQITLNKPIVQVITYKGENTDNFNKFITKFKSDEPSNKDFKLKLKVELVDGKLSIVNQNLPTNDQYWLDASQLYLKAPSISVFNSDVQVTVDELRFKGIRRNESYDVSKIKGKVHYSDTKLAFEDLFFQTDTSLLLGKLIFSYTKENGMTNFSDHVNWDLDLKPGSKISGKDIRYFVKDWDSNSTMVASSKAEGTLNNLKLINPIISSENTIYSAPYLFIKDMASSDKEKSISLLTEKAHLQTSYTSLTKWLPKFISSKVPEVFSNVGIANYKGDFSLDKQEILVKGTVVSSIGEVIADVQLYNYSENVPTYKGYLNTHHLNLAPFTKTSTLGPITSKISFDGKGFDLNHLDTKFDAYLSNLQMNNKEIHGVSVVGKINNKIFKGNINTNDQHVDFNFEGNLDFSQKTIKTTFDAEINKLDISYFTNVVDKNTIFRGDVNADVKFSTIDDVLGKINITSITITKDSISIPYNDINIQTSMDNGLRNLDIFSPNMLTANIYGNYKLNEVPAMLQEGVGSLLVNYKPKKAFKGKEFSFILDVQKDLFDLLMIKANISPGTTLTGRYIGDKNQLQVQMISEYVYYDNIKLKNPNIFINTADSLKQFMGNLSSLSIGNNSINDLNFSGFKRNDSLFASTKFNYGKTKDNKTNFDLNLYQTRKGNDVIFGFKPSDIEMPQTVWTLNPEFKSNEAIAIYNTITGKLSLQKIGLRSTDSEIMLTGEYSSNDNYNFDLDLNNVLLEKVIPANLLKDMTFEGVASGTVEILKTSKEFKPIVDFEIKGLKFNKEALGNLNVDAIYNSLENKYEIDAQLEDSKGKHFLANGYIQNKKGLPAQLDINLIANEMNVAPIGSFLQSILSRFRGTATGEVHITGDITNPKYQGILTMSKVGFKLNFTGVDYELTKDQDLQISDGIFLLDNIELRDTKDGTIGNVFGPLMTKNFSGWGMDLEFSTNRLLVLNTTITDNDLFFGTVYASGNFSLTGSTASGIQLSAKATALNGSSLTINSSSTTNATDISYIKFLPEQKDEDVPVSEQKTPTGFSINAEVTAHSNSVVKIIISDETGDNIEVRGNTENLKFKMNQSGVITMDGTYTIAENSKYYYKMFLNKDFNITPGSTIRWENQAPTAAIMDIKATYSKSVSNIGAYLGIGTVPASNVTVTALLTGNLAKPEISFDINADVSSSIAEQLKTKLNNNEGEKFNQVAGIVLFGNFIASNMGGSSYASSAYDVVLKQLTSVINNINNSFSLNASYNAGSKVDNTSDRISLDPTLHLNKRLSIIGSVNMPLEQKSAADVWTYGAKINYDVSTDADGSLIISGFSKPSTFGLETSLLSNSGADNQAYGGSIIYKRSFNSLKELFKKKDTKKDQDKDKSKKEENSAKKDTLSYLKFIK